VTITSGYCTRTDVEEWMGTAQTWTANEGAILDVAVEAASRLIDEYCNRYIGSFTGSSSTASTSRVFSANNMNVCYIDDVSGSVTLATDENGDGTFETTWTAAQFQLEPLNAPTRGRPYNAIRATATRYFPSYETASGWVSIAGGNRFFYAPSAVLPFGYHPSQALVQITSTQWGWPAIPTAIKQATIIQAAMIYQAKEAPAGLMGTPDMGQVRFPSWLHPQAKLLVEPYKLAAAGVVL
jgi:hypothetical protein